MKGIVPSLNTPFDADGELDLASLRRLVDHTVDAGCGGMLCLAVAGEHSMLTPNEKARFVDVVAETNANRIPLIVSVTAPDAEESVRLAGVAKRADAAGICVQLPSGFGRRENLEFLQELTIHGPQMLMIQDLDWIGDGMPLEEIVYLFNNIEQFWWLKIETQRAGPKYTDVLEATDGNLNVCGGWAVRELMDAMARGVHAFIPTAMERVYVAIYSLYQSGSTEAANALFQRLLPILMFSNQHIDTSIRFFKELRKAEGLFDTSVCRGVTQEFDQDQRREADLSLNLAMSLMRELER